MGKPRELMVRQTTLDQAQRDLATLVESVRCTGEPVVIEDRDGPIAALVNATDLEALERLREQERHVQEFARLAARASDDTAGLEPTEEEEEIVRAVKATREAIYRERYGGA
jgi:prevent-host-death family protein